MVLLWPNRTSVPGSQIGSFVYHLWDLKDEEKESLSKGTSSLAQGNNFICVGYEVC